MQRAVLDWYAEHRRDLPWRDIDDPYAVLVSEIMLQQTQVTRVLAAFDRFLARFPDVAALAAAARSDVVREWQGLGYNRRAVALHRAAQAIVEDHGGVVPADLDELLSLPGVGGYTARAVMAFAFAADVGPVDTNVRRLLIRCLAGAPTSGRALQGLADAAVPAGAGRDWSAALMDLGAAYCTARPRCGECPLRASCVWSNSQGPDPAAASTRGPTPFAGSSRYHRGRLLDALRAGEIRRGSVARAALLDDDSRATALAEGLVADGLAEWHGDRLRLPS